MTENEIIELGKAVFDIPSGKGLSTTEQAKILMEKAPLAEQLANLAFRDKDPTAWKILQDGVFDLPIFKVSSGHSIDGRYRPFFRGETIAAGIRDICWEIEEQNLPPLSPPKALTGEDAAVFIEEQFRERSLTDHPVFKYLAEAEMTKEQERRAVLSYLHSVMVRIRTVHRGIMLVQIPMEFHDCIKLSPLVVDELGGGVLEKAHAQRTAIDIEKWGDTVDWHAPVTSTEMKAMLNWNLRTVTHPDELWSFTGIFCIEWNSYLELRAALLALRKRGIPDNMMEVLVQHGDGDPYDQDQHALLVRQELGRRIKTPEDTAQVYTGIAYHQGLYHSFFEGEFANLRAAVEG